MSAGEAPVFRTLHGAPPTVAWSLSTEGPLAGLRWSRETGEVLAADALGGLYAIDTHGRLAHVTRGPAPIRGLAASDNGSGGVALVGDDKLYWFNRKLLFQGCLEHPTQVTAIAMEPLGQYLAVSLTDGEFMIYDRHRRRVARHSLPIPLVLIEFLPEFDELIGVGEHGLLCRFKFSGERLWQESLFSYAGDLAVTGAGDLLLLAAFTHGVVARNGAGQPLGSYQLEGTALRVAMTYGGERLACGPLERGLFWIERGGQVVWQAQLADDLARLAVHPLGFGLVLGLQSGRIVRLNWSQPEPRPTPR